MRHARQASAVAALALCLLAWPVQGRAIASVQPGNSQAEDAQRPPAYSGLSGGLDPATHGINVELDARNEPQSYGGPVMSARGLAEDDDEPIAKKRPVARGPHRPTASGALPDHPHVGSVGGAKDLARRSPVNPGSPVEPESPDTLKEDVPNEGDVQPETKMGGRPVLRARDGASPPRNPWSEVVPEPGNHPPV